jgi:hypothetical protein
MPRLTAFEKRTLSLLSDFDSAAKNWGWQQDQGTGRAVIHAEKEYDETRHALLKHLDKLHKTRRRANQLKRRVRALNEEAKGE